MKLTRKELYDLVWSEPMIALAKRFGLSDNGLRKHCKSMNIPTPPVGYWNKLEYGKSVEMIPLPENYEGKKTNVDLREVDISEEKQIDLSPPPNIKAIRELEIRQGDTSSFIVPEVLYAKDALIIDTKEKHREDMIPWSQRKNPYKSKIKDSLDIYVGEKSIDRALCIFSTIINALRFRGYNIKIDNKKNITYALIKEEEIQISLSERRKRNPEAANPYDNNNNMFCGEFHFKISSKRDDVVFKDTPHTRLEDKIIAIVAYLEVCAEEIKEDRIAEEERRIRYVEEERIRKEKEAKEREEREKFEAKRQAELKEFRMMFNMAERLRKANMLRQYIADYEEYLKTNDALDDEVVKKLEWARKKADWLDPFIDVEDEYLNENDKDERMEPVKTESNARHSSTTETERYNFWTRPYRWFNKKR